MTAKDAFQNRYPFGLAADLSIYFPERIALPRGPFFLLRFSVPVDQILACLRAGGEVTFHRERVWNEPD